jgi:tetratricopeptide (TPR) repeat protein
MLCRKCGKEFTGPSHRCSGAVNTSLTQRGIDLFEEGQQREARELLRAAIAADPSGVEALIFLGRIETFEGQYALAEAHLLSALERSPSPLPHFFLGDLYLRQGFCEEAEEPLKAALEKAPEWPEALLRLGLVFQETKRPGEALACYERAVAADGDSLEARLFLAQICQKTGDFMRALNHLQFVLERRDDPEIRAIQAVIYRGLGKRI